MVEDISKRGHEIRIWGLRGCLSLLKVVKMIRGWLRNGLGSRQVDGKWIAINEGG